MNTIALQHATAATAGTRMRRKVAAPVCLSAQSPVYVLLEPPST